MATFEEVREVLPVVFDVVGLSRARAAAKREVEKLHPGDVLDVRVGDVPEYSSDRFTSVWLDVFLGDHYAGHLFGSYHPDWRLPMEALADYMDELVFTVEEMVPQAERTKRAKAPKLTVKVDVKQPEHGAAPQPLDAREEPPTEEQRFWSLLAEAINALPRRFAIPEDSFACNEELLETLLPGMEVIVKCASVQGQGKGECSLSEERVLQAYLPDGTCIGQLSCVSGNGEDIRGSERGWMRLASDEVEVHGILAPHMYATLERLVPESFCTEATMQDSPRIIVRAELKEIDFGLFADEVQRRIERLHGSLRDPRDM